MKYLEYISGKAACFICVFLAVFSFISAVNAMEIQKITSPRGIQAWFVEDHSNPLLSLRFSFYGGSAQDPEEKPGLAYFVSGMLDEGAGDLDSTAFQERAEDLAARLSFEATRDVFTGHFQTLTEDRDASFELLRLALNEPRFEKSAVERIKAQISASVKIDLNNPETVAAQAWYGLAFGTHPYAHPRKGTLLSLESIVSADLKSYARRNFARDNLKIAVVGDIDKASLGQLLDKVFGGLPEHANLKQIDEAVMASGVVDGQRQQVIEMNIPQSVAVFGLGGLKRDDPDFIAGYILNYIVGGGGFASRLMEEVREKRGLAYSIYSYLYPFQKGSALIGSVATRNKDMTTSLDVIRGELRKVAEQGLSHEDLKNAKSYLTGSYALRFDTGSKITSQLLWTQVQNLGDDYIAKRNSLIRAVTLDDLRRVARRLLDVDQLLITIVGKPEGLSGSKEKS